MRRFVTLILVSTFAGLGARVSPVAAQNAVTTTDSSEEDLINADRPGIADGSRTLDARQAQLEIGAQHERHVDADGRERLLFFPTLLRYGMTGRVEARVESGTLNHAHVTAPDGSTESSTGVAPVLLGGKVLLYDSHGDRRRSLGTIVRVAPPSGSGDFRTSHTTGDVRLAGDWDFAPHLSLNPNVGAAHYEGSGGDTYDAALGALTLTYSPNERVLPFVDAAYQSRDDDSGGTWSLVVDTGVAWIVGRDVQLDLSAGSGAHGSSPPKPFIAAGISVRAR